MFSILRTDHAPSRSFPPNKDEPTALLVNMNTRLSDKHAQARNKKKSIANLARERTGVTIGGRRPLKPCVLRSRLVGDVAAPDIKTAIASLMS